MVMWIVLGSLVGVVIIFLVVTTVLDKKKTKILKTEKDELKREINNAAPSIIKKINSIVKNNETLIKKFVPSVGKMKMSDINKKARDGLKEIKSTKDFKLLKHEDEVSKVFAKNIDALIEEKSNNWSKRNMKEIKFFAEYKYVPKQEEDKKEKTKKTKKGNK